MGSYDIENNLTIPKVGEYDWRTHDMSIIRDLYPWQTAVGGKGNALSLTASKFKFVQRIDSRTSDPEGVTTGMYIVFDGDSPVAVHDEAELQKFFEETLERMPPSSEISDLRYTDLGPNS